MMPPDTKQALAMLDAFRGVGATSFYLTLLDIDENEQGLGWRSGEELRRGLSARLEAATRQKKNIVIRPRSTTSLLAQLDDLDDEEAARIGQHGFMTVRTSPNGYQVWLAVSDGPKEKEAAKQFRKRIRKGAGADKSATGAVRLAGSLNIKPKYAPDFPVVTLSLVNPGKTATVAEIEAAGLLAAPETVTPARSVPQLKTPKPRPDAPRHWPDWTRALAGAPLKKDGSGPDRSMADFMFCKWSAERGWQKEEIAAKLLEVSPKAQERAARADEGYATLTAENAFNVVERERARRQSVKSTPAHPR